MSRPGSPSGITLVELLVSSLIMAIITLGLAKMIQLVSRMAWGASKTLPAQREYMLVTNSLEKDFLGASRFSILNSMPFGGFEDADGFSTVPDPARWSAPPLVIDPIVPENMATAGLNFKEDFVHSGRGSMVVTSYGNSFGVRSPVVTLPPGTYRVGAWVMQRPTGAPRIGGITVLGDPISPPSTPLVSTTTVATKWVYLTTTFPLVGGNFYRLVLGPTDSPGRTTSFIFDDVFFGMESVELLPGNGQSIFFEKPDPSESASTRVSYEVLSPPRLVRSLLNPDGTVASVGPVFPGVKKLKFEWVTPVFPLGNPMDRAVHLTVESDGNGTPGTAFNSKIVIRPATP